jgi:hypothetical protein
MMKATDREMRRGREEGEGVRREWNLLNLELICLVTVDLMFGIVSLFLLIMIELSLAWVSAKAKYKISETKKRPPWKSFFLFWWSIRD